MSSPQLIEIYTQYFLSGGAFPTIVSARQMAASVLGVAVKPGTLLAKQVDEVVEGAIVRAARQVLAQSQTTHEAYDSLLKLHHQQPTLGVRSSTSVAQQAYSTPLPIAYLASTLAGITPETTIYEPTAGHAALLMAADPMNVTVNELNPDRANDLRLQGYTVTEHDATSYRPQNQHDSVITNPPFGQVKEGGETRRFQIPGTRRLTTQIDQAIAFRALEALKDNGKAVLILGGKLGDDEVTRSQRYNTLESRNFFFALYQQYRVVQHVSIWGDLYAKYGAAFPIDLIVINGRGQSERSLPAANVPKLYKSFAELKELILNVPIHHRTNNRSGLRQLSHDLEPTPDRETLPRQSATDPDNDDRSDLRNPAVTANSRVDSNLDGENRRESTRRSQPVVPDVERTVIHPRATQPLRDGRTEDIPTALVVETGMGGDVRSSQRNPSVQSEIGGRSQSPLPNRPSLRSADAPRPRRPDTGSLAARTQLWHGRSLEPEIHNPPHFNGGEIMATSESQVPNIQPLQVPYVPRSQGRSPNTIIPANMATAAQIALDKFEQEHGNIDDFVYQRLNYDSREELWRYFYAEQIDAMGLAFTQLDKGNIFLNGDQTGNGKGRFGAANLIQAKRQGYIPIFVTHKPDLYNAMINDLADVGRRGFTPFCTNNDLVLSLDNGRGIRTRKAPEQEAEMLRLIRQGNLGEQYDAIFTTYSQLQTVDNGKEPFRREFFRAIAPRAIFIFDESHQAGGSTSQTQAWESSTAAPNRAEFVRELVDLSAGAVFMSATATKDPAVMDLYARRTDARQAVSNIDALEHLLRAGGIPLQQMVATKFVASGQLLRRERSMEGIAFDPKVVSVDREVADGISAIMRSIDRFDRAKQDALKELNKELKKEAKALGRDNAVGDTGAKSTNFTSLMHNAIDQGLLCQKAETTVQEAIASLQQGEKPVIAVASTMDAFIKQYADEHNLQIGDSITISFGDVLSRYLDRSRDVTIRNYEGIQTRRRLEDNELGVEGVAAYEEARELIDEVDLSGVPLSSIDYIRWRLTQEGYRVDEVTGRKNIIEYSSSGETFYGLRPGRETSPQGKIEIVNRFNSGRLDVVILNRSGSTGISLHASEKFTDQNPRHMIVAQAERDINEVMQMLGRVNRFGQVVSPKFTLLMSDLPAEKRLGAILAKKMASLNANTTAARESDMSISQVVDFMNIYGEEVITEILENDIELDAKLSFPTKMSSGEDSEIALISRVTGRIPLLSIAEQEQLYSLIESETVDLIAQKQAMGESVLEAEQLDLDARMIARMELVPDESGIQSEFTGAVYLEVVDARMPVKPMTQLQVINIVRENLELELVKDVREHDVDSVAMTAKDTARETYRQLRGVADTYRQRRMLEVKEANRDKVGDRLDKQLVHVGQILQKFPPGTPVQVVSPLQGNITYGVISRVWQKDQTGSPAAPNNWRMQILTDNRAGVLTIPLSKFNTHKDTSLSVTRQATNWSGESIYESFDSKQVDLRMEAQIFTGNILKAFEKYPKGKFVNYTDDQGNIQQGLVMPAGFDILEELRSEPVAFKEPEQVRVFMTELTGNQGVAKSLDEVLSVKTQAAARLSGERATGFVLQVPKATQVGGKYFLDQAILAAIGADFYSVSDRMESIVPADRIEQVLNVIMQDKGIVLAAFDFKDQVREYLGQQLPTLEKMSDRPTPPDAPSVPLYLTELIQDDPSRQPQPMPSQEAQPIPGIAPPQEQKGGSEKNVARFLQEAGLSEAVLQGEDFHQKIENEPYIPLVVERHGDKLYLTHYLEQNGDLYIDSEMVFKVHPASGQIRLKEIAMTFMGMERRTFDRGYAQMFSRNILDQGFAQAAQQSQQTEDTQPQTENNWRTLDRTQLDPDIAAYLNLKDQNPEVLLLQRSRSGDFYEAYFTDAQILGEQGWLLSYRNLGEGMERVPVTGVPARTDAIAQALSKLRENGYTVVMDEGIHRIQTKSSEQEYVQPVFDLNNSQVNVQKQNANREAQRLPTSALPIATDFKQQAEQLRHTDLSAVASSLGLGRDRRDKSKWKDAHHTISINGNKFMDWRSNQGGNGAIDLVMQVQQTDFSQAVQWLAGQSLPMAVQQSETSEKTPRPLEIPVSQEQNWVIARQYLTETRGLPEEWIDSLHNRGLLYADDRQNLVFLRHSHQADEQGWTRQEITGATLRGTNLDRPFYGQAPGSSREQGWFWLGIGSGEIQRVILLESAIDAISLATLNTIKEVQLEGKTIYLSTDGCGAIPTQALQSVLQRGGQVVAAFDADQAGEIMAWRVAAEVPGMKRMIPAMGKDWNERLLVERQGIQPTEQNRGDKETLRSLWKWHQTAAALGRQDKYLQRITEVAIDVVNGEALSEQARRAMQQDFQTHQQVEKPNLAVLSENKAVQSDRQTQTSPQKRHQGAEMGE